MKVVIYRDRNGYSPFYFWLTSLEDKKMQSRILARINRIRDGNLGDHKFISDGIWELRFHFGSGFRVYYFLHGKDVVFLLNGGDKSSQRRDINKAISLSKDYLRNEV